MAVLVLQPSPTSLLPVAVARAWPSQAPPGAAITFDASGSYPVAPGTTLVAFRWDFDEDGVWDAVTSDPNALATWRYDDDVRCNEPGVLHRVTPEVEDSEGPTGRDAQGGTTRTSMQNHPPAAAGSRASRGPGLPARVGAPPPPPSGPPFPRPLGLCARGAPARSPRRPPLGGGRPRDPLERLLPAHPFLRPAGE